MIHQFLHSIVSSPLDHTSHSLHASYYRKGLAMNTMNLIGEIGEIIITRACKNIATIIANYSYLKRVPLIVGTDGSNLSSCDCCSLESRGSCFRS